jgi:hypothetical protein
VSIVVDKTPPAPPATDAASFRYRRVPWGDSVGGPRFAIELGTSPGSDAVRAFAWTSGGTPSTARAGLLGEGNLLGAARATIDLGAADRPVVFVSVVDGAGNESDAEPTQAGLQATRVSEVVWTATLGNKVAGSTLENPHRVQAVGHTLDRQLHASTVESGGPATVRNADGSTITTTAGVRFIRGGSLVSVERGRLARQVAAFDRARGVLVAVPQDQPSPWEHDGHSWRQVTPADPEGDGNPLSFPEGDGAAYHHPSGFVVLVDRSGTTWGYDGVSWRTLCRSGVAGCLPQFLRNVSLSEDDDTGELVLFGGLSLQRRSERGTFVWNGTWREVCTAASGCVAPPARHDAVMAYDPLRGVTVLFGGRSGEEEDSVPLGDVWEWDGLQWTERDDLTDVPTPRSHLAMAFDPAAPCTTGRCRGACTKTAPAPHDHMRRSGRVQSHERGRRSRRSRRARAPPASAPGARGERRHWRRQGGDRERPDEAACSRRHGAGSPRAAGRRPRSGFRASRCGAARAPAGEGSP